MPNWKSGWPISPPLQRALLAAAILSVLAGCGHSEFAPKPEPQPRACEDLARQVGQPIFADDEDPYNIAAKYKQKLGIANGNLWATAKCQRDVREGGEGS